MKVFVVILISLVSIIFAITISAKDVAPSAPTHRPNIKKPVSDTGSTIRIAIIDTGLDPNVDVKLCPKGHYDYATETESIGYSSRHGSVVASIIADKLKDIDYCVIVLNAQSLTGMHMTDIEDAVARSIFYGASYINYSLVGEIPSRAEKAALERANYYNIKVFAAAGNDHKNLDKKCDAYPVCYNLPNVTPVGALGFDMVIAPYSNRGKIVKTWKQGVGTWNNVSMQGTSFATPRALSDYVLEHPR